MTRRYPNFLARVASAPARFAFVAALAVAAADANAQSTGGRFGGSRSFGSSGSSFGGSRSSSFGSSFGSSRSSSFGSSYRPPPPTPTWRANPSSTQTLVSNTPAVHVPPPPPPRQTAPEHLRPRAIRHAGIEPMFPTPRDALEEQWLNNGPSHRIELPRSAGVGAFAGGFVLVFGLIMSTVLMGFASSENRRRRAERTEVPPPYRQHGSCELRRVSIAFDWTDRARLQAALAQAAAGVDTNSVHGLYTAAARARDLLAAGIPAARYAAFQTWAKTPEDAERTFGELAREMNGRYERQVIAGKHRALATDLSARGEEGQGFVVVTLLVGTTVRLAPLPERLDPHALHHALATLLPHSADQLVALEVVWSPAQDQDRLSSAELEVVYPELVRLDANAAIGRVVCTYCSAVYAHELGTCPACGAHDPRRAPRAQVTGLAMVTCEHCRQQTPAHEVQCQQCGARARS